MRAETDSVLVVDDEHFSRIILTRQLREIGRWEILTAKDGTEALSTLTGAGGDHIQVVVADLNMPMMNGLELLRSVRSGFGQIRRNLPVMLVTGHSDVSIVSKAMELDVNGFLAKPQSKTALETRILKVLQGEDGRLKPAREYLKIELPAGPIVPSDDRPPQDGGAPAAPVAAPSEAGDNTAVKVAVHGLAEGASLAADVRLSDGTLVVSAGHRLSSSLIERLIALSALDGKLKTVWIKTRDD